jgi:hypothetical protein
VRCSFRGSGCSRRCERKHDSASSGFRERDLDHDGSPEFATGDVRFEYLFGSYADSRSPLRILGHRGGSFVTLTGRFPARSGAPIGMPGGRTPRSAASGTSCGVLAAWAAEKYLLREGADVWPVLDRSSAAGELTGYGAPAGRKYVVALRRHLRQFGYLALK